MTSQPTQFETSQTQNTSRPTQGNIVSTPSRLQPHGVDPMLQLMFTSQKQQQQMLDAIQLPKTEIVKFDGDPLMYWLFIRSFENNVDRVLVDNTSKLTRLIYYCTGKALKAIQCCAAINPDEGFYRAKSILKERFGNDYVIAEAWITKVTSGSRIRPSDREGLQEFSDDLNSCQETLTAMGRLTEIMNQQSLVNIVERLPIYLLNRWRREAHKITKRHGRTSFTDIVSFVKDAAEDIAFNKSIETGVFPSKLKIAKVIPIYKSKDKQSFTNYRPISLLPSISKIYEKLVHKRLYAFMTNNLIMNKHQFGFRQGHSTINAITKFTYDTLQALDSGHDNLSVFLDLSKAFDTINHQLLCRKLQHYGICGVALEWFRSYLSERKQYVSYKGINSQSYSITCGVPQGSVLGPLLFIIYTNDLPGSLRCTTCILFADDTTIYCSGCNIKEL